MYRRKIVVLIVGSLFGLFTMLCIGVGTTRAHPLDEYLHASYITLTSTALLIDVDLSPGVLVASQILPLIDTDKNGSISEVEGQQYAKQSIQGTILKANEKPIPLTLNRVEYPSYLDLSAGTGIIRLHLSAPLPAATPGSYTLFYEHSYEVPGIRNTYLVNGFIQTGERDRFRITDQQRDYLQHTLLLSYTQLSPGTALDAPVTVNATGSQTLHERVIGYLHATDLSPALLLLAVGIALLLGGLHALTPGHGKTLIAAYLIGSRGTVKHAIALGGIVTLTHTASVIVIGLIALFASQYIVPGVLLGLLQVGAGLLVFLIGVRLIVARWLALRAGAGEAHLHRLPDSVHFGDLLAMGVSGGVVPCPEALGILLVAIGLQRIPLGLALILSFSIGLATILIGLGVLLVRFKPRIIGEGGRWSRPLPLVSAVVVTFLGLGVMLNALASVSFAPIIAVIAVVGAALIVYKSVNSRPGATTDSSFLPPRYRTGKPVSNAPMGSAELKFDAQGEVAWDEMWTDFCDLALAGGPPHRGTLLEPVSPESVHEQPEAYEKVIAEIARGLRMVTGLEVRTDASPGWIGLVCSDEAMALWLLRAILVENVSVRREGHTLFFPAGSDFRLDGEIKNVVTVVAKTHHYWIEHADECFQT